MSNMYDYDIPPENKDDISLFLRQILLSKQSQIQPPVLDPNHTSSSVIDNPDDDCESEEGYENVIEEMPPKSSHSNRNSSKRTRAAEVHNMSEKRRRNRINEKMKALQKLIPNSNKMLTMRNGINLYSMSVPPGVLEPHQLPHSRIGLNEPANMMPLNQETHVKPLLSVPIQCPDRNQLPIPDFSHTVNPGPSSSLVECMINSNELMNLHQKYFRPVVLDGECAENGSYENAKR